MRTVLLSIAACAAMTGFFIAPASAAEDCEAIEERRARTECVVAAAYHALDSDRVNTCARQIVAVAMVETITKAELHLPQALQNAATYPEETLLRIQGAVADSSKLLAELLWLLQGSDSREVRKAALNICVRELGKSPFDSEPEPDDNRTLTVLRDTACEEPYPYPAAEDGKPVLANLLHPLYCGEGDMEIVGEARPEGADQ